VIRGGVYEVDLGSAPRGHEQRGRRRGLVISPSDSALSVSTIVPTSTRAQSSINRPEIIVQGKLTRFLTDQTRVIDNNYIGEMVDFLSRDDMAEVEHALSRYFGI